MDLLYDGDTHRHCEGCFRTSCSYMFCNVTECPTAWCHAKLHQCKLSDHLQICQSRITSCYNAEYGCIFQGSRSAIRRHLAHCPVACSSILLLHPDIIDRCTVFRHDQEELVYENLAQPDTWFIRQCPMSGEGCTFTVDRFLKRPNIPHGASQDACCTLHGELNHTCHAPRLIDMPYEILTLIVSYVDSCLMNGLRKTCRLLRDVCDDALPVRGIVSLQWSQDEFGAWCRSDNIWEFANLSSPKYTNTLNPCHPAAIESHLKQCPYLNDRCDHISENFRTSRVYQDCDVVECPTDQCPAKLRPCELSDHREICEYRIADCYNAAYGCAFQGNRSALRRHLVHCPVACSSMIVLSEYIDSIDNFDNVYRRDQQQLAYNYFAQLDPWLLRECPMKEAGCTFTARRFLKCDDISHAPSPACCDLHDELDHTCSALTLLDMPHEILFLIVSFVDSKSMDNLGETCLKMHDICTHTLRFRGVVSWQWRHDESGAWSRSDDRWEYASRLSQKYPDVLNSCHPAAIEGHLKLCPYLQDRCQHLSEHYMGFLPI